MLTPPRALAMFVLRGRWSSWLQKSGLIAAPDREIDAEANDAAALTHEARPKTEAEVLSDLL